MRLAAAQCGKAQPFRRAANQIPFLRLSPEKSRLPFQQGKGTVVVEVTVGTDGSVKEAKAISGPIFLKPLAERAATKARFAPDRSERKGILTYQFK